VAYITQTTLSLRDTESTIAALKRRFPRIVGQDTRDICYATQNRQSAVLDLAKRVELLLVIGSENSSNTNRLREIGESAGIPSYLIEGPGRVDPQWLADIETVGITAGASAPEVLVEDTIAFLRTLRRVSVEELDGRKESVRFRLPDRLSDDMRATA
jgi:4-hydroxy-3-methylbut-2-enyl diphosphate reductase